MSFGFKNRPGRADFGKASFTAPKLIGKLGSALVWSEERILSRVRAEGRDAVEGDAAPDRVQVRRRMPQRGGAVCNVPRQMCVRLGRGKESLELQREAAMSRLNVQYLAGEQP